MIHFHKSPNLDDLVTAISKDLNSVTEETDPFSGDLIVVQNRESQGWLQSEISRRNGVAANFRFVFPSELIWFFFRHFQPDLPSELPSDRLALEMRIFEILGNQKDDLEKKGLLIPESSEARLTIAENISDVFDLYQMYRPEMLFSWENHQPAGTGSMVWQSSLWNRLVEDISSEFEGIPFRHHVPELLKKELVQNPGALPDRIFVFGISHWSKSFSYIAKYVSKFIPLYWYDQNVEPLGGQYEHLQKWGETKREIVDLLNSSSGDLKVHSYPADEENRLRLPDGISIHSCHSPEREVQILRQELLAEFDRNPQLSVEDVLIMVPNPELYAPYIQKEFPDIETDLSIPVYISSTAGISTDESVLKLLDFFLGRERVSDFLDLISLPVIREGFELDEEVFQFVSRAFSEMNIHYGLKISDSDYSIEKGITQLYLGYTLNIEPVKLYDHFAPISLYSSGEVLDVLTKISRFFRYLVNIKSITRNQYSIKDWLLQLKTWMQTFHQSDTDSYINRIDRLTNQAVLGGSKTKIVFADFVKWLKRHQTDTKATSTRRGTGVTVSSYIPYRNIPFKFVGILGLNEHAFPRKPFRPEFDLIHARPEPGDRITQQDDELLFLERLLSTQERLHLSFIGEGENGKMPSSIITRLNDDLPDLHVQRHKLHGFSEAKSLEGVLYPSVDSRVATSIADSEESVGGGNRLRLHRDFEKIVSINDLILFFSHPGKYLISNQLEIKNIYESVDVADREVFELDGLQKFKLREILDRLIIDEELNPNLKPYLRASGVLPKGLNSVAQFDDQLEQITMLKRNLKAYEGIEAQKNKIEVLGEDFCITGELNNYFKNWRIEWGLGSVKSWKIISAWIGHLASQISVPDYSGTKILGISNGVIQEYSLAQAESPRKILNSLVKFYMVGDARIENFSCIPELSRIYTENLDSESKANTKLEKAWFSTDFNRGEDADFYHQMIWKDEYPWDSITFKEQSKSIWEPILDHLEVKTIG